MKRNLTLLTAALITLALAAPSNAQFGPIELYPASPHANATQTYDYLYGGLFRSSLTNWDGNTPSGFGIEIAGSKAFRDHFHVWGNAARVGVGFTESLLDDEEYKISLTTTAFNIGAGTQFDATEKVSLYARAGLTMMNLFLGDDELGLSDEWNGFVAAIGAVASPAPKFKVSANAERIAVSGFADFVLGVAGQYEATEEVTARAHLQFGISDRLDGYSTLGLTGEYRFTEIMAGYLTLTSHSPDQSEFDIPHCGLGREIPPPHSKP